MQCRGAHLRRFDAFNPHQPAEQIQRMDRLRDQHAAAVARPNAAARIVVVGLRPPPWYHHRCGLDRAERTLRQYLVQATAAGSEADLQADAEAAVRTAPGGDQLFAPFNRHLQRLLAQHMLPGGERGFRDRQVCVRGCEHQDSIDRRVFDGARDVRRGGKAVAVRHVLQPCGTGRRCPDDTHAIGEINQAPRMWLQCIAKADDRNAYHGRFAV